jgi:hypothetical protein
MTWTVFILPGFLLLVAASLLVGMIIAEPRVRAQMQKEREHAARLARDFKEGIGSHEEIDHLETINYRLSGGTYK